MRGYCCQLPTLSSLKRTGPATICTHEHVLMHANTHSHTHTHAHTHTHTPHTHVLRHANTHAHTLAAPCPASCASAASLPPIAPLTVPSFPPLDHDWCASLHPSTTLTLHALVASHRALRDAVSFAVYAQSCGMLPPGVSAAPSPVAQLPTSLAAGPQAKLHGLPAGLVYAAAPTVAPPRMCLTDQSNIPRVGQLNSGGKPSSGSAGAAAASNGSCVGVRMPAH